MSYEEEIALGVQAYLDVDLQFPQENHVREVKKKVQTNGDLVRRMSDEELATMIHAIHLGWTATWCDYHCENQGDDGCDKCILDWLKQPAEIDT